MPASSDIQSYRDLDVWKVGMQLATQCYKVTRQFPKNEEFGLTSQIRRAGSSIPSNIAEGYGRESTASFVQFLRIAQGSLKELETHIMIATNVEVLSAEIRDELLHECSRPGIMIRKLIRSLEAKLGKR